MFIQFWQIFFFTLDEMLQIENNMQEQNIKNDGLFALSELAWCLTLGWLVEILFFLLIMLKSMRRKNMYNIVANVIQMLLVKRINLSYFIYSTRSGFTEDFRIRRKWKFQTGL